jgi:hypothetical protein
MKMQFPIVIKAVATIGCLMALTSCGEYEALDVVKAPNGVASAKLFIKDRGSAISSKAYIELAIRNGEGSKRIFSGSGGWPLEVKWAGDNRLIVKFCGGKNVEYNPTVYYEDDGMPSEIIVVVITESRIIDANQYGLRPCVDN